MEQLKVEFCSDKMNDVKCLFNGCEAIVESYIPVVWDGKVHGDIPTCHDPGHVVWAGGEAFRRAGSLINGESTDRCDHLSVNVVKSRANIKVGPGGKKWKSLYNGLRR